MIILIVLLLAVGAVTVWRVVLAKPGGSANTIVLSGRIEGDDSAVSSKATGRLLEARVREGDEVKAGDIIAVLDDQQMRDREAEAQATVAQSEARLRICPRQIAVLEDQLRQNSVETGQSKVDANGRVARRKRSWRRPRPTWRSRKPLINWLCSTKTLTRGWPRRARYPNARASRRKPPRRPKPARWPRRNAGWKPRAARLAAAQATLEQSRYPQPASGHAAPADRAAAGRHRQRRRR